MKKGALILIFFLFCLSPVFASSDVYNDYTLIDCISGNDSTAVEFDSNKPYQTLKKWIEQSISYINSNVNKWGNEETASGKIFSIKVKCSANNLIDTSIILDFKWTQYNNELIIEWIWDNWLIIQNTRFYQKYESWNIIFKNAKFLDAPWYYFYDENLWWGYNRIVPQSNGIKIIDSYIELKNQNQFWSQISYSLNNVYFPDYYDSTQNSFASYYYYYNYSNQQNIENSVIEIEIDWDYDFKLPGYIKDSKIIFINKSFWQKNNITFLEEWNPNNNTKLNYSVLISNDIDLWENNLFIEDDEDIAFINNTFYNFNDFNISGKAVYFNNTIDNTSDINISSTPYLYNTSFSNTFTDTYDVSNMRRNYQNWEKQAWWVAWIFKRNNNIAWYFDIDFTSVDLFNEITQTDIPDVYDNVYVIFQK